VGLGGVEAELVYHDPDDAARKILMLYADPSLRL
jgi:hypothetical protein